jgi:EmrB/QacA subfamily drug resistance transporter
MSAAALAPPAIPRTRVRAVFAGLMLALLLASLDQTIVATALPTIVDDLGGLEHISWVTTAYLLASTTATPLYGKLGDLYGRKRLFQFAIVLFLAGSVLCGVAQSMLQLILFRAVQGLGGGGLIVLAMAIVGDVVSPRERGRYQGLFGAVFGVSSVAGPLLGGFFVEHLTWRWIFYVNVPLGLLALAVVAAALPSAGTRGQHAIDWLGTALMAAGVSCVILFLSLGGTTQPWGGPASIALVAGGVVLLALFALVERRAAEPILPLRLFANRVFAVASAIGFIVGFGMFGAITFLPLFLQIVNGATPTESGLEMLPLMAGVLATSIASGQIITRTGRYKVFPIAGTAITAAGFALLARLDPGTPVALRSLYMLVLGLGLGMVMQVLVLAVQNAVEYRDLGVATSGATFFRSIGGSFGVAVFGTIFSNRLESTLASAPSRADAYAQALQTVFLVALPIALVAFALTWLLREQPLRRTVETAGLGESFAVPKTDDSLEEIARAVSRLASRDTRKRMYERLAQRAGTALSPAAVWLLFRIGEQSPVTLTALATRCGVPYRALRGALIELETAGYVDECLKGAVPPHRDDADLAWAADGGVGAALPSAQEPVALTAAGTAARDRLLAARQELLSELAEGWSPEQHEELARFIARLARDLVASEASDPPPPSDHAAHWRAAAAAGAPGTGDPSSRR